MLSCEPGTGTGESQIGCTEKALCRIGWHGQDQGQNQSMWEVLMILNSKIKSYGMLIALKVSIADSSDA